MFPHLALAVACAIVMSSPWDVAVGEPKVPPSMSVGAAFGGALVHGVPMPQSEHWTIVHAKHAWGTRETIAFLVDAITSVEASCSATHPLFIGDISRERGGPLWPHRSHQSGRDVDLSFYYRAEVARWYQVANAQTLDVARTWALLRALITRTDVEYVFINRSVQRLLHAHALRSGEDRAWLERVFQVGSPRQDTLVRHARGHATHMHVRFYNRRAQAAGHRDYGELLRRRVVRRHPRLRRGVRPEVPERLLPPREVALACR